MDELAEVVQKLRTALQATEESQGKKLEELYQKVNPVIELAKAFSENWLGGWAQGNYNHYVDFDNPSQTVRVNDEYFYEIISKRFKRTWK